MIEPKEVTGTTGTKKDPVNLGARWYWYIERNKSSYRSLSVVMLIMALSGLLLVTSAAYSNITVMQTAFDKVMCSIATTDEDIRIISINQKEVTEYCRIAIVLPGDTVRFRIGEKVIEHTHKREGWFRGWIFKTTPKVTFLSYVGTNTQTIALIDGLGLIDLNFPLLMLDVAFVCYIIPKTQRFFRRYAEQESYGQ